MSWRRPWSGARRRGWAEGRTKAAAWGAGGAARGPWPAVVGDVGGGVGDGGDSVAVLDGVAVDGGGAPSLRGANLTVRRGKILGVAGVDGNGQRALAGVLAGVVKPTEGTARLPDEVGWIPQDRGEEGLVNEFTITENVAFALHGGESHRKGPWLDWAGIGKTAAALVREMDVRAGSPDDVARTLSGGNQQKVVTGREFLRARDLLVAESPTRGLDVKATRAVRARIAELAKTGERPPGIVLISADLDEILELADRIVVIVRGRLISVPDGSRTVAAIGELMLSAGTGDGGAGEAGAGS